MKHLNLTNIHGQYISYDLTSIKNIKNGKAKDFYSKEELVDNNIKVLDSLIVINFKNGKTSSFSNAWTVTFS